jgi:hypothetical protein
MIITLFIFKIKMKIYFLIFSIIFNSLIGFSQKISKVVKDKFENKIHVYTTTEKIASNLFLQGEILNSNIIGWYTDDDTFNIKEFFFIFQFKSNSLELLDGEGEITLILSNGEIIKSVDKGKYRTYSKGEMIYFFYWVGDEYLDLLCKNNVTDIRIETYRHNFDYVINSLEQKKIRTIANLLIKYEFKK